MNHTTPETLASALDLNGLSSGERKKIVIDGTIINYNFWSATDRRRNWIAKWILNTIHALRFSYQGYEFLPQRVWVNFYQEGHASITVDGAIIAPHGRSIGIWSRDFSFTKNKRLPSTVEHTEFRIRYKKHRGHGLAKAWLQHCIHRYEQYGFKRVEVTAGGENGRYTWAAMGFEWDRSFSSSLFAHHKKQKVQEIITQELRQDRIDSKTAIKALRIIENGLPRNMKIRDFAALGKQGNGSVKGSGSAPDHLGKQLLLEANVWDGHLNIKKWLTANAS